MNRNEILTKKYLIIKILNINDLQYSLIIEQLGYEFLRQYFSDKEGNIDKFSLELITALTHSKTFWIWWLYRWDDNDSKYFKHLDLKPEYKTKEAYIKFHRSLFYPMPDYLLKSLVLKLKSEEYAITE